MAVYCTGCKKSFPSSPGVCDCCGCWEFATQSFFNRLGKEGFFTRNGTLPADPRAVARSKAANGRLGRGGRVFDSWDEVNKAKRGG